MAAVFTTPQKTVFGKGALQNAASDLAALGRKPLIVTGNIVRKGDAFAHLTAVLHEHAMEYAVFSDLPSEPDDEMVEQGAALYRAEGCDCLIGVGGGTPLDTAKAIGIRLALPGGVCAHAGQSITAPLPPMALIPTTAGTGSEATQYTVITERASGAKLLLKGPSLLPRLAVVDETYTYSTPPALTAATGVDALTHAVEAYTSRKATPLTDPFAVDAIRRILHDLPAAFTDGQNQAARASMSIAAYEAGVCINNASVTLVHGMSRPIGAHFHVTHGLSNAMLLLPCLRFAAEGAPARFAGLAHTLRIADPEESNSYAVDTLMDALDKLLKTLQIPTLSAYGVPEAEYRKAIPRMAEEALQSGSPANTLRDVTLKDVITLYETLYN